MASPEDDERCTRDDGKKWRCKKARKQGETLCDQPYAKKKGNLRRPRVGKGALSHQQPSLFMAEGKLNLSPNEKEIRNPPITEDKQNFSPNEKEIRNPPMAEGKLNLSPNEKEIKNLPFVAPLGSDRELSFNKLTEEVSNKGFDGASIKEKNKVKKVAVNTFQRDLKDLEHCTAEAKLKDVGRKVTSVEVPAVKETTVDDSWLEHEPIIVYKRRVKTTIFALEKLKRNKLTDHMSNVKEETLMMSSDVVHKVSSRPKEVQKKYSVVTEADQVPITKANPYHAAKNEGFDPNFLMETAHHEIPPEDVQDPFIPNLAHTTTSLQKTSKMIAEAVSGVGDSSVMKYNEEDTSSLDASFSISACMKELRKYHYISTMKRLKAAKELQSEDWRETFLCMDEDMRKAWIESLE